MELIDVVKEALITFPDVLVGHTVVKTVMGNEFTHFYINRRGTVFQFTAPYPSYDEHFNTEFIENILKEI